MVPLVRATPLLVLLALAGCGAGTSTDAGVTCAGGCDDANPCTADSCAASGCEHAPLSDTSCDDANACTTVDVCRSGVCTGETPVRCGAPGTCERQGVCDSSTGQCSRPLVPVGTPCDDALATTSSDACDAAGTCVGDAVVCPINTVCTTFTPDGTASCAAEIHLAAACNDGDLTTSDDACDSSGTCVGSGIVCPADTACVAWLPDGTATCASTIHAAAACDDADLTTFNDRCDASGTCIGTGIVCAADTACVSWLPDGTATCASTIHAAAACDDADLTTFNDQCAASGTCAGTTVTCPASDACSTWTPNGTATCVATRNDGVACDDQNACTPTGSCLAGTCVVGAPVTCLNGGACSAGQCACATGWTGPTCAVDIDECALSACGGASSCTNSPGSYGCQCVTNYSSPTGANCTSTDRALELVVFYDEGAAKRYGPDAEARIASIITRTKALFDTGLSSPALTISLNAVIRMSPLPGAIVKRSCDTAPPGQTCVGCWDQPCVTLQSNLASEVDHQLLLSSFGTYSNTTRRTAINTVAGGFDVALLLTDADLDGSITGYATIGGACSGSSASAIVSVAGLIPDQTLAVVIAHELGHTLGMLHDATGSFIMAASSSITASSYSPESLSYYRNWIASQGACLATGAHDDWVVHHCGNGVIDDGETCDPAVLSDGCCSSTCQLNPGCVCGNTEPCCANGAPRDAGTQCSVARSECDVADTCDGQTGACHDRYQTPLSPCLNGGYCLRGECASRTVECRTVIAVPPYNTWTGCETSTHCDRIECTSGSNVCGVSWALAAKDGTHCGAASQCVAGLCVASAALKDYQWLAGGWSACSAQGVSTRSVTCVDEAGTPALASVCDSAFEPLATRTCTP